MQDLKEEKMNLSKLLERRNASSELSKLSILEMQDSKAGEEANEFFNEFMNLLLENRSLEDKDIAFQIIFNQPFLNLNGENDWFSHWQNKSDWAEMSLAEMKEKGGDAATFANLFFKFLFPENQDLFEKLIFPKNPSKVLLQKVEVKEDKTLDKWAEEKKALDNGKQLNSADFRRLGKTQESFYKRSLTWLKKNFKKKSSYQSARKKIYGEVGNASFDRIGERKKAPKDIRKRVTFPWSNFSTVKQWEKYRQEKLDGFESLQVKDFFLCHDSAKSFYYSFMSWTERKFKSEKALLNARDLVLPLSTGKKRRAKQKRPTKRKERRFKNSPWKTCNSVPEWKEFRVKNFDGLKIIGVTAFFKKFVPDGKQFYLDFMKWAKENIKEEVPNKIARDIVFPKA